MSRDRTWPTRCTLQGCTHPNRPGHHHHFFGGHLTVQTCRCPQLGEPGTRPAERGAR